MSHVVKSDEDDWHTSGGTISFSQLALMKGFCRFMPILSMVDTGLTPRPMALTA
jgi:hypothetical protein